MRKLLISAAAVASLGVIGFAPAAFATPEETTTTAEVAGYPPEATTTTVESSPATLEPEPEPSAGPAVIAADLPTTGGNSIAPLQIGAGFIIAGLIAVVVVRRRRASPAT